MDSIKGLSGPGIIWTASRIRRPGQLDGSALLSWYDKDVMPRAVASSGISAAFRAISATGDQERPNIVCFALSDLAFCEADEYKALGDHYGTVPGKGDVWEILDMERVVYNVINVFDHAKLPISATKSIMAVGWDLKGDIKEQLDKWWNEDHCQQLAKLPGFVRTSKYRSKNTWWSAGEGATLPCPDFLELIEFSTPEIDVAAVIDHEDTSEEAKEIQLYIMDHCNMDMTLWSVEQTAGETMFT